MMENLPRWQCVLGLWLLLALGLLFVPECDDCYFVYWHFDSLQDWLHTRPITTDALVVGVPSNGRVLGNLLGVLQGKAYFTPLGFLRGLGMGGALAALVSLLGTRFVGRGANGGDGLGMAFVLVILAPRGIWQQVYAWGAALVNYLLPMLGLLLLLHWLDSGRAKWARTWPLVGVTAFASCLFMEPVTILLAVVGGVAPLALWRVRPARPAALALWLGSWAGAATMFLSPGYTSPATDTRRISLALLGDNFPVIIIETLVRPAVLALLVSALLLFLLRRQRGREWMVWGGLLGAIHLLCLGFALADLSRTVERYTPLELALGCAMAILWVGMLLRWRGGVVRGRIWLLVGALCVVNAPLLIVSPVGPRNFFPAYVLLCLVVGELYPLARREGLPCLSRLRYLAAAAALALVVVYGCNFVVYHQRLSRGQLEIAQGATQVTLPLLPFSGWAVNEQIGKGDLSYLLYRETPWDVALHFTPYGN